LEKLTPFIETSMAQLRDKLISDETNNARVIEFLLDDLSDALEKEEYDLYAFFCRSHHSLNLPVIVILSGFRSARVITAGFHSYSL